MCRVNPPFEFDFLYTKALTRSFGALNKRFYPPLPIKNDRFDAADANDHPSQQ